MNAPRLERLFIMRYVICLAVGTKLIVLGAVFVQQTNRLLENALRQTRREAKAAGELPPEVDPEQAPLANYGVSLPPALWIPVKVGNLLSAWRFSLIAIVLPGSFGVARMLEKGLRGNE